MKIAILGVGRMGRRHIQVARQLGLEVVGIFDRAAESLELACKEHSIARGAVFDDPEALFERARPQAVVVATTADSHCELVCLAAGKGASYVLVEKPMAVSVEQCDRMIAECAKRGARLAVNHQMRFMEQYSTPKALLDSAAYGGMTSMTVVAGNFGMAMNGSHYVEAFRYMAGEDPAEVTGWFSPEVVPNPRGARFEDRAGAIRVVSTGGRRLYVEIGADQGHGLLVTYAARNGIVCVDELTGDMHTSVREPEYRELPTTRYAMPAATAHERLQPAEMVEPTARVLDALLTGVNNVTGEHGRVAVQVLAAAHESAEAGSRAVRLDRAVARERVFPWA